MPVAVFCILFFTGARAAETKVTRAVSYELKNVTRAGTPEGSWHRDKKGIRFLTEDGKYVKNRWIRVGDAIYYLDSDGRRASGWVNYREYNYYMDENGRLKTGWAKIDGATYYFKSDGKKAKGLYEIDGCTYYFSKINGIRRSGWLKINGGRYYFSKKTYRMCVNTWIKTGKKYYYVGRNGRRKTSCWLELEGKKYYLGADGARVTGNLYLNRKGYYFDKNGVYQPQVKVKDQPDPRKPMVALTFDDGPGAYTKRLLSCLKKNDAKATFFLVGSSVSRYAGSVKLMAEMECEIGSHSYSHPRFTSLSVAGMKSEVQKASAQIRRACGKNPTVFRLPYGDGASNSTVLSALGLPSVYWSIDTRDWANTGNPQHTVNAVLNHVQDGDIVLMHDIHYSSVVAAEKIIPALKKRGYQLVTVSELAKYKGKTSLKSGRTYYHFR